VHEINGGGDLTAAVDSRAGGRIVSLASGGREWLSPSFPLPPGEQRSFVHAGTGGWDDAIPTVEACSLGDGSALGDHGEVWDREWRIVSSSPRHLSTSIELRSLPLRFERLITATTTGLRLDWRVTTTSPSPVSFLWSAHPLFAAEPDSRIVVEHPGVVVEEYPERGRVATIPGSIADLPAGGALKLFASGVSRASVVHADSSVLTLTWDAAELPFVGLYLDRGEFTTRPVLAIEPTMAATDSAARATTLWTVSAGEEKIWHLDIASSQNSGSTSPSTAMQGWGSPTA